MPINDSAHDSSGNSKSIDDGAKQDEVTRILTMFYAMMGHAPEEEGAIGAMAAALCADAGVDEISAALHRCMHESRGFPVRLPHIFARIAGHEVSPIEAEMRAAWDVLVKYVNKWCRWDDGYFDGESSHVTHARPDPEAPKLPNRLVDSVRRTGGWAVYLRLEPRDYPYQQQRFYDEYKAWVAVERVLPDLGKALQLTDKKGLQLAEPRSIAREWREKSVPEPPRIKPIPNEPTAEELRDRREMLKQQAATAARRLRETG